MTKSPLRSWLPAYFVLAVIWGCSFLFIKVGLQSLTPAGVALSRLTLGLLTMLVVSAVTRTRLAPRAAWWPLFVTAAIVAAVPWTLFAFGEEHITSALAGIINGSTPLMTLLAILLVFPEETPTRERMVGLGLGFVGILIVVGVWQGLGSSQWMGIAACLGAVALYGISYPYMRRHLAGGAHAVTLTPIALSTGLMAMGTLQAAAMTAVTGYSHAPLNAQVVLAMLALGVLGSGIAYVLNFRVIKQADATTASTVTYFTPLVAVVVGALVLGEPLSWNQPLGGLIVVLGAAIAQGTLQPFGRTR